MPNSTLLELDPDKLFEEHNVVEIRDIQVKLHAEIERKREDLRTMVGERYRDLIEAADTIRDMKSTAEEIILHIGNMSSQCQSLQQRYLLGFKLENSAEKKTKFSNSAVYHAVAIQVKILIMIPEQIWSAIEIEDFLNASQLYLLACHITAGLQLPLTTDGPVIPEVVRQWFPVVLHQSNSFKHFQKIILSGCEQKLQAEILDSVTSAKCLLSLVLLEGLSSKQLLDKFLALRIHAIQKSFQDESITSVKIRIAKCIQLIVNTLILLHSCFLGSGEEGLVWQQLKVVTGPDAQPTLNLLDINHVPAAKFIPSFVQKYRPPVLNCVEPVAPGVMRESVSQWLNKVQELTTVAVRSQLQLIMTVKGLQSVRQQALSVEHSDDWEAICQQLMIPRGLNIWKEFFQPRLTDRAKQLAAQQWDKALQQLCDLLRKSTEEIVSEKCVQTEHDLRWFVWKECLSDARKEQTADMNGLLKKLCGYSPCVQKLCKNFDSQLEILLHDLSHYLGHSDSEELQEHLLNSTQSSLDRLITFIKEKIANSSALKLQRGEAIVVLMARFLQAVCDLCPNLYKCLALAKHKGKEEALSLAWQDISLKLHQESLNLWKLWSSYTTKYFSNCVGTLLKPSLDPKESLSSLPKWDVQLIEEEGEGGQIIKSEIHIPSQPSLPLQALLNKASQVLNSVIPHTLPRKIHQETVEAILSDILDEYAYVSESTDITQIHALQFLLDIRFISSFLLPRDNKALLAKSQSTSEKFEDKIDPFDLDVFTPYLQMNVKLSISRLQVILGVLVVSPEKLMLASARPAVSQPSVEDPNVIALSTGSPWLPLLPLTGPMKTPIQSSTNEKFQQKSTVAKLEPKVDPSPSEQARSVAVSLFSDWFGS